ncbi:CAP-associated domain-containing protein [Neobacillus sp. PS3-34]|uniref:CAP-associated domain-containing protein n=1 Tax=Neobacillus sp. PS3-34 TaxID=3070678 RepID=UPI0027DF7E29|nr:CAP-associated domain-containing protein [Neobacillus sp. PS3-34]WML46844.1 CAP-associated domain-containing protein [Neobacillus sp. PS3-34]
MKKFTHKLLKLLLTAFFISSVMPAAKSNAEDICSGIGPNTVVRWDNDELRIGQIGRLMVIHDTPLFKLEGDKKTTVRMLKAGEKYRIYAFKPGKLSVGGGLYVDRNTMIKYETPSQVKLAQLSCKSKATAISKMSIQLDELKTTVEAKFGKEKRVSLNEYGDNWYTYHNGYRDYYMVSYLNGRAAAIFTMDDDYYLAGIHVGSSLADVKNALGTPIKGILKGNINYLITNNNELETFYKGGAYITVFYDIHNLGKVTGIQVVSAQEENKRQDALERRLLHFSRHLKCRCLTC